MVSQLHHAFPMPANKQQGHPNIHALMHDVANGFAQSEPASGRSDCSCSEVCCLLVIFSIYLLKEVKPAIHQMLPSL